MQFSEKLKKLRAEKGVSQSELADKIYVSRSAVAKWENGLGLPSGESLTILAEFFGVDKSELLSDPETASVIINKNNKLSKQKLWIIILIALTCVLIAVAAVLIPLALQKPSADDITVGRWQELVFETEKDIADLDAKNYSDENLSADKYFAPTRIFTYNSRNTTVFLPKIMLKQVANTNAEYVYASSVDCSVSDNCTVGYSVEKKCVYIVAPDAPYSEKTEYCINLSFGDMRLSLKLRQEAIQVENIEIQLDSERQNKVEPDSTTELFAKVTPFDATYQAIRYAIEKVLKPDGTPYDGYSQYANLYTSDKVYLRTTKKIDVGARIFLYAIAEKDQIRSNRIEIEIVRNPISDIEITSNSLGSLSVGATCWFKPIALDEDATFNVIGEQFQVVNMTPELAKIEYSRGINTYFITATSDRNAIGKSIVVLVATPEGFGRAFYWTIEGIPIEEVFLVDADTGEQIDQGLTLLKGETMRFAVKVLPENADYFNTQFIFQSYYSEDFTISQDGDVLTVTAHEDALSGITGYVRANVSTTYSAPYHIISSKNYSITVESIPVERVILKTDTDVLIKGQTIANLNYEVFPANAEVKLVALHGIDYADGVHSLDWQVWADYSAVGGSHVSFMVTCGDVESNIVTLTVQKIPVEEVTLGITSLKIVIGMTYPLTLRYNEGADPETVEYKFLDKADGVRIVRNYLFIPRNHPEINFTTFRVQAVVDGIESNILIIEIVDKKPSEEIIEITDGITYVLDELLYPDIDSRSQTFVLLDAEPKTGVNLYGYGEVIGGTMYYHIGLHINPNATIGMVFHVMAIVDGVTDTIYTFKVVDQT